MAAATTQRGAMFRFLPAEVAEMEATAQQLTNSIFPSHEAIDALTAKFNVAPDRAGKVQVQSRQVLTWFHNHRYAPRIKEKKARRLAQLAPGETLLPAPKLRRGSSSSVLPSVQASSSSGNRRMGNQLMGKTMLPRTHVQRHSTPFQPGECVDVRCNDHVLCLQDYDGLSIHCDARVLATRRRHDGTNCRCRFFVRFEHDKSEEMVPLEKLRRPPAVDNYNYRLPNLYQASRVASSADCRVQPTKVIVDLTSDENSSRAEQREPKQYKLTAVNTNEATVESNSEQEKPANDAVGAFPGTSPETCNVSALDVATRSVNAAPVIIEIDDD